MSNVIKKSQNIPTGFPYISQYPKNKYEAYNLGIIYYSIGSSETYLDQICIYWFIDSVIYTPISLQINWDTD